MCSCDHELVTRFVSDPFLPRVSHHRYFDSRRFLAVIVAVALLAALTGCTAAHTPARVAVKIRTPTVSVSVVDQDSPAERAIALSRHLFAASPVVVVAPAGDPAAERVAARTATRWGVPMLLAPPAPASTSLTPSSSAAPPSVTAQAPAGGVVAEVGRLHATTLAAVGDVAGLQVPGVRSEKANTVHPPARATPARSAGVLVVATADATNAAAVATAQAAGAQVVHLRTGETSLQNAPDAITALHASTSTATILLGTAFRSTSDPAWSVAAARSGFQWAAGGQDLFPANRFVALYGTPGAPSLGVLGEQGPAKTITRAQQVAAPYKGLSGRPVTPMLEIIATVAAGDPGPGDTYSHELPVSRLEPYVDAAAKAGMPVVIDLQPGRTDFLTQAKQYESLLEKPNVGLALDPEWRLGPTQVPLKQIGSVSAAEVNSVSSWLSQLVDARGLPPKMFVLHQFRPDMLQDRDQINTSHPELATVIHVDGQGSQPDKQATWIALHTGAPSNVAWGWKNFYDEDTPMLTPEQTMTDVTPTPDLITYQ